jgi:hypothetical protein
MATKKTKAAKKKAGPRINAVAMLEVTGGPQIAGYGPLRAEVQGQKVQIKNIGCRGGWTTIDNIRKLRAAGTLEIENGDKKRTLHRIKDATDLYRKQAILPQVDKIWYVLVGNRAILSHDDTDFKNIDYQQKGYFVKKAGERCVPMFGVCQALLEDGHEVYFRLVDEQLA